MTIDTYLLQRVEILRPQHKAESNQSADSTRIRPVTGRRQPIVGVPGELPVAAHRERDQPD